LCNRLQADVEKGKEERNGAREEDAREEDARR
jgi:hypothetical protein